MVDSAHRLLNKMNTKLYISLILIYCWNLFDSGTFWGSIAEDIETVGPPTGFQGINATKEL